MQGIHKWGIPLVSLTPDKLCLITLINAVNGVKDNSFTALCLKIASDVKQQREFELFRKGSPTSYEILTHKVKKWDRKAFRRMRIKSKVMDTPWDHSSKVWLGAVLLNILVEDTGKFEHVTEHFNRQTHGYLRMTDETHLELEKQVSECEVLKPFMLPMVVPPKDWNDDNRNGGYLFLGTPLMKPHIFGAA